MGRKNKKVLKNRLKSVTTVKQYTLSSNFDEARHLIEKNDNDGFINCLNNYRIDINDLGEINGSSLLMVAAECNNLQAVQELIRRGADINYQDSDGWSALLIAVKEENSDVLIELLDAGADLEAVDCGGFSPLMWSAYKGTLEITKILLKRNANPNVYDLNHLSPLVWASGRGYLDIAVLLIGHGAKVDSADKYGTTSLIWASRKGYLEIVQKLLKAGANVDQTGMFGWTSLIVATRGNFEKVVEVLLEYKPNVNASDAQGMTPLMTSAKGNINIVNMLIHSNSYVNLTDKNGDTALIHACKAGNLQVVESLIKAHAAVDHQGDERKTALYWAVEKGHIEVIKALLKVSPNLELQTKDGDTCLMKAVRSRKLPIVKMLVDRKAKISAVDKYGDTVLHIAARAQSKAILEFILRNPRNSQLLYKPNKNFETPFQLDYSHQKPILPTLFGSAPSSTRHLEKETQLGYDLYSSAIANLLSEPSLKTPICVGLFAKWGSGKSFLIGKLKEDLLAFTKDWMIQYSFKFSWTLALLVTMISSLVGAFTLIASLGKINLALIVFGSTFCLIYLLLIIIHFGSSKYHWSISYNIKSKLDKLKLILQICFGSPPLLNYEQISSRPVRFLFTETPIKISTDYNVCQLIAEIHKSLWKSIENKYGYLSIKLFKVFQPKPISSSTWKWRRVCGIVPTILLFIIMFFAIVLSSSFVISEEQVTNIFRKFPISSYIAVGMLSIAGAWILGNITTPFKILRELIYPAKCKTREELKKEVELMQSCIHSLDAFTNKKQIRLVIILDALESIYESDRLISFLEAVNINFLSARSHQYTNIPFVIILTLDPHHHVTSKSKEYLKTIVHLPFYLQNSQLRRVKIAQQTLIKSANNEIKSSTTSLVDAITQAPLTYSDSYKFGSTGSTYQKKQQQTKKGASFLKSADSIVSLVGNSGTGEVPTKVLLTDDYFSDVNPKSMRRIMNIVYIQGRLLKAFNLDFSWHKLTTWVNITEQWPLRASSLIVFYENYENKYTDDGIPLKMLYDKVCFVLEQSKQAIANMKDSDEKKLNAFLSLPHNSLTLADLKIFAPFVINLDPYIMKIVQEIFIEYPLPNLIGSNRPFTPVAPNRAGNQINAAESNKSKLSELNVDGVIALLKQIDGFDLTMIDKYSNKLKQNNINGKVLANCSAQDLEDLKNVLDFTFGDWLLFKKLITENKQLTHLHTLAPALLTSPSPYHQQSMMTKNQQQSIQLTTTAAIAESPAKETFLTTGMLQPIVQPLFQSSFSPIPVFTTSNQTVQDDLILNNSNGQTNQNYLYLPNRPSNLEKQATMEEAALQSDIIEDDEESENQLIQSNDSFDPTKSTVDNNEVDILYINKNSSAKISPSVSLVEDNENYRENTAGLSGTNSQSLEESDTTPLVSGQRRRATLERQRPLDNRETLL